MGMVTQPLRRRKRILGLSVMTLHRPDTILHALSGVDAYLSKAENFQVYMVPPFLKGWVVQFLR